MKLLQVLFLMLFVLMIGHTWVPAETSAPEVKITEMDTAGEKTPAMAKEPEFTRSKDVSKYGTFEVIQTPFSWMGKALDGLVWGVGKIGSTAISLVERPFHWSKKKSKSEEGGQHGNEKNKKA